MHAAQEANLPHCVIITCSVAPDLPYSPHFGIFLSRPVKWSLGPTSVVSYVRHEFESGQSRLVGRLVVTCMMYISCVSTCLRYFMGTVGTPPERGRLSRDSIVRDFDDSMQQFASSVLQRFKHVPLTALSRKWSRMNVVPRRRNR